MRLFFWYNPFAWFFLCVQSETETDLHIFRRLTQTKRTNKRSALNTSVHKSLNPALQTYLGKNKKILLKTQGFVFKYHGV